MTPNEIAEKAEALNSELRGWTRSSDAQLLLELTRLVYWLAKHQQDLAAYIAARK